MLGITRITGEARPRASSLEGSSPPLPLPLPLPLPPTFWVADVAFFGGGRGLYFIIKNIYFIYVCLCQVLTVAHRLFFGHRPLSSWGVPAQWWWPVGLVAPGHEGS